MYHVFNNFKVLDYYFCVDMVTGEDEATKKMDQMWEEADVYQLCKQEAAVAIKIKGNR